MNRIFFSNVQKKFGRHVIQTFQNVQKKFNKRRIQTFQDMQQQKSNWCEIRTLKKVCSNMQKKFGRRVIRTFLDVQKSVTWRNTILFSIYFYANFAHF